LRIGYPADLDAPLCVDILAGRRIGCAPANVYRGDLATAGMASSWRCRPTSIRRLSRFAAPSPILRCR